MTHAAGPGAESLPPGAYAVALSGLAGMGPARLHRLIAGFGPTEAWERVCSGFEVRPAPAGRTTAGLAVRSWSASARAVDVAGIWTRCRQLGIDVSWPGEARWPAVVAADPQPPGILFWRGDLDALRQPAVAVVGTRQATPEGRSVAFELGHDLSRAGVSVVSGLALGIDGAAHAGALAAWEARRRPGCPAPAPTVGVAASGVDVIYPRRHEALWARVAASGVVLSETPPGGAPSAWRFPARNRIIVALVRMVVVVESHRAGGSLVTVEAALARGTEVCAVPGPVWAPTSAGPNQLLHDGAPPVRHAGDVLDGLGMIGACPPPPPGGATQPRLWPPALDGDLGVVMDALGWQRVTEGQIVERTGLGLGAVGGFLDRLEGLGLAAHSGGRWSRAPRP